MLRMCVGKHEFSEINFRFTTALDPTKRLKQIKIPISLHTMLTSSLLWPKLLVTIFQYLVNLVTIFEIWSNMEDSQMNYTNWQIYI